MPFALMVASKLAALYMADARAAKAHNRPAVVAHYVKQARSAIRDGRRGYFGSEG